MKFVKKPVVVEAFQLTLKFLQDSDCEVYIGGHKCYVAGEFGTTTTKELHDGYLLIPTLEGDMKANIGDWIITGIKGEIYPCKPDIFKETYDPC